MESISAIKNREEDTRKINYFYYKGDYDSYRRVLDEIIDEKWMEPDSYGALFMRAMAFEKGIFGEVDLESAKRDLDFMTEGGVFLADVNNSIARIIYKINPLNIVKSTKLVQEALEIEDNTDSMIYMGYLCAKKGDHKKAFSWYKKAADHKDPWGYVFMSEALAKEGKSFASFWLRLKAFFIDKNTLRDYQDVYPFFE